MPAFSKFAWRWIVGTTAAAMLFMAALPSTGHADTLKICISNNGRIKGINVDCGSMTSLTWETIGVQGSTGPEGVDGPAGFAGPGGASGPPGIKGATGSQGANGPTGAPGTTGDTGAKGPTGIQGNPGIQGIVGLPGNKGISGFNGGSETNKTFLTGGTLGELGEDEGIELDGLRTVGSKLVMGPGNGADTTGNAQVPMNDNGSIYHLFVNTDNNPGFSASGPISYFFQLCNARTSSCLVCTITGSETTCRDDLSTTISFTQGDLMGLFAWTDDSGANSANVKWSVTFDHGSFITP